jgi:methylated-DNA-protein-cysteine methyltransferase-like protein
MNTFDKIYNAVKQIPYGKVATYGQIAAMCGNPRLARVVGYALHVNPDPENIPCFRVVNKDGRTSPAFAFGGQDIQKKLLSDEGVEFDENGYVLMEKYLWK